MNDQHRHHKAGQTQWTRRAFAGASTSVAIAVALPRKWPAHLWRPQRNPTSPLGLRDPAIKALALQVLDVARSVGAAYADVRMTSTIQRDFGGSGPSQSAFVGLSVRALVNGAWGWAAHPMVTADVGSWLAREAVRLAVANAARGTPRVVDLGVVPPVQDGTWTTPLHIDPFEVALEEVDDWLYGILDTFVAIAKPRTKGREHTGSAIGPPNRITVAFEKQERVFASTDGSYLTQTRYVTSPNVGFQYRNIATSVAFQGPVQGGWEVVTTPPVLDLIRQAMDRIDAELADPLPVKPVQLGRYDLVASAAAIACLLNATLGYATEVDRALGYEANAGGTSYLGPDPLTQLGTQVASPLITVTANRSTPAALATIGWDDEGVVPDDFTLVNEGILVDYQTTREQAAWLAPWYARHSRPVRSHGCAAAPSALEATLQHQPNLILHPGPAAVTLDDLVASMSSGLLVENLDASMDFQHLSGLSNLFGVTEVRHGKRVARWAGPQAMLFRAPELWKSITALGGRQSQQWLGRGESTKGEPSQTTIYSIAAVPALLTQQAVIDPTRKA